MVLHTQKLKRLLERAGFVFLRGGWVRREVAPRLQDKIDAAVRDAADDVEKVRVQQEAPKAQQP